jgi:hypothetical protein
VRSDPRCVASLRIYAVIPDLGALGSGDAEVAKEKTNIAWFFTCHVDFDENGTGKYLINGEHKIMHLCETHVSGIPDLDHWSRIACILEFAPRRT